MGKTLYHFTSYEHLEKIVSSGKLKLTPSNLLAPKNLELVDGALVDRETDGYHPVVWMTDSDTPEALGLDGSSVDKERVRLTIRKRPWHKPWGKWATAHNMDKAHRRKFTQGFKWKSWYVSELEIPLEDVIEIYDMKEQRPVDFCGEASGF